MITNNTTQESSVDEKILKHKEAKREYYRQYALKKKALNPNHYKDWYQRNRERIRSDEERTKRTKEYTKQWYQENRERELKKAKEYQKNNREVRSEYVRNWLKANPDKYEKHLESTTEWIKKNKKRIRSRTNKKYQTDPQYKLSNTLRTRINHAVKNHNVCKSASTMKLVGCDITTLKEHIESQFVEGMSWDNYNHKTWHIDHIKPCNAFDLSDPEQQKQCFHYTNLRPLWATDNLKRPKDGRDVLLDESPLSPLLPIEIQSH